jgi:hypothetical protein
MKVLLILILTLTSYVCAHFTLDDPESFGFEDAYEPIAPCGGFLHDLNGQLVNFSISGDWIQINNHHPKSYFTIASKMKMTQRGLILTLISEVRHQERSQVSGNYVSKSAILRHLDS